MPKRACAIVGSHPNTRDYAPYDRNYIDIWVFNESASLKWPQRVNAVFQMHAEPIWRNPTNRNDPNYMEWMKQPHPYPVYMMDVYPDVPASVKYPLEEICQKLLSGLFRGKNVSDRKAVKYFTSSVTYAIALAIYQEYEEIHIYGVEMETNTEYTYQRDGVFFWLGIALGRGIKVIIHEKAGIFSEPLYGYEGDVTLHREDFEARIEELNKFLEDAKVRVETATSKQIKTLEEIEAGGNIEALTKQYFASIKEQAQATIDYGAINGGIEENKRYLSKAEIMEGVSGKNLFSRQEFEQMAAKAHEMAGKFQANMHQIGGMAETMWGLMNQAVRAGQDIEEQAKAYQNAHQRYLEACFKHGRAAGIYQENLQFLKKIDKLIKAAGGAKSEEVLLNRTGYTPGGELSESAQAARVETPAPVSEGVQ